MKTFIHSSILFLSILIITNGCGNIENPFKKKAEKILPDSTLYTEKNYTEYILDSNTLLRFLKNDTTLNPFSEDILDFYRRREFQYAWFTEGKISESAGSFRNQWHAFISDFNDSTIYNFALDTLIEEAFDKDSIEKVDAKEALQTELLLTTTFFRYADKAYNGISKNPQDLEWFIPRKKKDYSALLSSMVKGDDNYSDQEPVSRQYKLLKKYLLHYRQLEKDSAFPSFDTTVTVLKKGSSDSIVLQLKKYFIATEDLSYNDSTIVFNDSLVSAIKRYQRRMGLKATGSIDKSTYTFLQKPPSWFIRQMMINLERLRWLPPTDTSDYIFVNIPEFRLHVFERDSQVWSMNVVVGRKATETNIFTGNLSTIVFSPTWSVPASIVEKEILPQVKKNTAYLTKKNFELVSGNKIIDPATVKWKKYSKGVPFTIRQKPGGGNALGKIKFLFPNSYSIYFHDTPSKGDFNDNSRAFSHGCIRLSKPDSLAIYLLRNDSTWTKSKIDSCMNLSTEYYVPVKPKLPVYIGYFTSWVDANGKLNFRNDIYGRDQKLASEIFGEDKTELKTEKPNL